MVPKQMHRSSIVPEKLLALALLGSTHFAVDLEAQQRTLTGRVASTSNQSPITLVPVTVPVSSGDVRGHTNRDGVFRLEGIQDTIVTVEFVRLGFQPFTLTLRFLDGESVGNLGTLEMTPLPTQLAPIKVEGERASRRLSLAGFHDRRKIGLRTFIDEAQLDEWNPQVFTDILRYVAGFKVRLNTNYGNLLPPKRTVFGYVWEPSDVGAQCGVIVMWTK